MQNQEPTVTKQMDENRRGPPVINTFGKSSYNKQHREWTRPSLQTGGDAIALSEKEALNAIASSSDSVTLKLGEELPNEAASPDRTGQDEEQKILDCVHKELCNPMVYDAVCRLINIPGVDMNMLRLATSVSSRGTGGGGGGSDSKGSHTQSQRRHRVAECTGSDLHSGFVSGLACGGGRGEDDQLKYCPPKTLSGRYANFVGHEEQPNDAHRNTSMAPLTAVTANTSMLPMFNENCEEPHVPSRNLVRVEDLRERDELCEPSLQTKPTEETLASLLPTSPTVMEETQLGLDSRHSIFVPKSLVVRHPHSQGPTVGITPMAKYVSMSQIPELNITVHSAESMLTDALLQNYQRLPGYEFRQQKLKNLLQLFALRRCRTKVKQLFQPYSINKKGKHGLAVIIANENFRRHPDHPERRALKRRPCAIADTDRLLKLLTSLGYRVRVETDLTAEQIENLFDEIQEDGDPEKTIQEGDDSFLCFISSHGTWDSVRGTGVVYGVEGVRREDGQAVVGALDIEALAVEKLSPSETGGQKLKGRPKMFFIQACRGGKGDRTISVYDPETDVQPEMDFLFVYSTAPGKLAYRDDPYGSFFITDLSVLLKLYAHKRDLISIIQALIQKETVLDEPYILDNGDRVRQCPNYTSTLRGPVFLSNEAYRRYERLALC